MKIVPGMGYFPFVSSEKVGVNKYPAGERDMVWNNLHCSDILQSVYKVLSLFNDQFGYTTTFVMPEIHV